MKIKPSSLLSLLRLTAVAAIASAAIGCLHAETALNRDEFTSPPKDVRVAVYWYWINDNISKEGVIADLHAMKRAGITRAYIGHIGKQGGAHGKIKTFTPEWWDVLHTALKTATELDIEIGIFNSPGWSQSGGPWIKPERAMRYLAASETHISGPAKISTKLPAPNKDFQDVKVLAFPAPAGSTQNLLLSPGAQITNSIGATRQENHKTKTSWKLDGKSSFINVKFPAPVPAKSLVLQFAKNANANTELQIKENGSFRTVTQFEINRSNFSLAVGFVPNSPIAISFPEVKSDEFRLVFNDVRGNPVITSAKLSSAPVVGRFPEKTLAKMFQTPTPPWEHYLWERSSPETTGAIKQQDVLDLSQNLATDGTLTWEAPAGEWIILRTGMTPTGVTNAPATPSATGLEVDKMSKEHIAFHFDAFLGEILRKIPAADRKSFKVAVMDSYETGGQNFTDKMIPEFIQRYGYDPVPFLPVYHGYAVGSPDLSDRFLWDVRRLIADKVAYDYVGGLRKVSKSHGLTTWLENYGHWGFPAEFLQYGGQSDEIGGEFWHQGLGAMENRAAASSAHIYGKKRVWAESFTGGEKYHSHPGILKKRGDWAFTEGVNSSLLHVYIQQYANDSYPGVDAWFGVEFNRKNTWFPHFDLFSEYLRRCNYLLQQGQPVADVAYFIGEDVPKMTGTRTPEIPSGYNYDYINAEVIVRDLEVLNGKLVLPHGVSYRVLVLPPQDTMRPEVLRKIEKLTAAGAIILGPPPTRSPSLQNYPAADAEIRSLAAKLWGEQPVKQRTYGKGKVFTDTKLEEIFQEISLVPEFDKAGAPVLYTHRTVGDAEVYFLSNQSNNKIQFSPQFRVNGKEPRLWNPVSGRTRDLPTFTQNKEKKTTTVPLQLEASESAFIVFQKAGIPTATDITANYPVLKPVLEITTPWEVSFESDPIKRGPKTPVVFEHLQDWSKHPNENIKYFSGKAVYKTTFSLGQKPDEELSLDLGKVSLMAKVRVNGHYAGGVWTSPYRMDVTPFIQAGKNTLEIEVVNNWTNRLIGDARLPLKQRKLRPHTGGGNPNGRLEESGLLGPVVLKSAAASAVVPPAKEEKIDREALVRRHTVTLKTISPTEILQVGNGEIAYGIDPTGLQTFAGNTMSHWSWHSVPCPVTGKDAVLKLQEYNFHGRPLGYRSLKDGQEALYSWMRENPHRFNLGRLRFLIQRKDGTFIARNDVKNIRQTLDPWTGVIECHYTIGNHPVLVEVCADPKSGALAVRVKSKLLSEQRMAVELAFPYGNHGKDGADWKKPDAHRTALRLEKEKRRAFFKRKLDSTEYSAALAWENEAVFSQSAPHTFTLTPARGGEEFAFTWLPSRAAANPAMLAPADTTAPTFTDALAASRQHWPAFWRSGGAVDLSGSTDRRWRELERRIVLSQYLLAVNEAGSLPPQESGLFNNGWYGKFHLEMHWWHGAHYGLWGRWPLMEKSLGWYREVLPQARALAKSQGFSGARWPKMIGPDADDAPSGTGPLLIWQQPHPIFYAELEYRAAPNRATLEKWREVVEASAEFMADFAWLDPKRGQFVLGPPLATVPENSNYRTSFNPTFELSYWRTGLQWAQVWRERIGLPRVKKWDDVLARLAPLPVRNGVYLSQENMPETYTKMNWEHPSLIGPRGMLPGDGTDPAVSAATLAKVWARWSWDRCWGWDFPMMAMGAARNGRQDIAIEALLHPSKKNHFNTSGLSTGGPFPYFPSNGGLLYAVAFMAAGWDGAPAGVAAPGFPQDGQWTVKWEGLERAP